MHLCNGLPLHHTMARNPLIMCLPRRSLAQSSQEIVRKHLETNKEHARTRIVDLVSQNEQPFSRRRRFRLSPSTGKRWESVIGLEVHAQIDAKTKLFSSASSCPLSPPNTNVSPLDAAVPGTLPVINKRCVEAAVLTSLALGGRINLVSHFDRKHYFYADLPAGYQITQQNKPIATGGQIHFPILKSPTVPRTYFHSVGVTQLQLEQDSGKSLRDSELDRSLIDLNRAGVALMEVVFKPQLFDGEEAGAMVRELQLILKMLGTCSCEMHLGAMRVDANVSVRPFHEEGEQAAPLGVRSEVKNLYSLTSLARAIEYEVDRQIELVECGGTVENETRGYDAQARATTPMRDKEVKQDYRFMPEPNLPPLRLQDSDFDDGDFNSNPNVLDVARMRKGMPELPGDKRRRLESELGMSPEKASQLLSSFGMAKYFEDAVECGDQDEASFVAKLANLIVHDLAPIVGKNRVSLVDDDDSFSPQTSPQSICYLGKLKAKDELAHNLIVYALETLESKNCQYADAKELVQAKKWKETSRDASTIASEVNLVISNHDSKQVASAIKCLVKGKEKPLSKLVSPMLRELSARNRDKLDMKMVATALRDKLQQMAEEKTRKILAPTKTRDK